MSETVEAMWLVRIAQHLSSLTESRDIPIFLYVEIVEGCVKHGVFNDEGNRLLFTEMDPYLVLDFYHYWFDIPSDKQWCIMKFLLSADKKFTVSFSYPNEVDVSDLDFGSARQTAAVEAIFGDKPTYYPPIRSAFELNDAGLDGPLG